MKKIIVVVALLAGTLTVQAQTVDEIVAKHVTALGGADKLKNLKAVRSEMTMQAMGNDMQVTSTIADGKGMLTEIAVMGMTIKQGFDGTTAWMINPMSGKEPQEIPAEQAKGMLDQLNLTGSLYNYKEKGNTVELLGKEKVAEKDFYKLKVHQKNGTDLTEYVDANTYLVTKAATTIGGSNQIETTFSDYRKVDGYTMPFNTDIKSSQGEMSMKVTKIAVNPPVDDKAFKLPAKQ